MTIQQMKEKKRELGYTNAMISQKTGLPLSTVQKILGGITRSPRRTAIKALEELFAENGKNGYTYQPARHSVVCDPPATYGNAAVQAYTIRDIESLPEDTRAELIDGRIYYMSAPGRIHQEIIVKTLVRIESHITVGHGSCKVYPAPFAVYLDRDIGQDYLEPDLVVVCRPERLCDKGCMGAPDWIMEVTSPSTQFRDYTVKLFRYKAAGVREYWIVNPEKRVVHTYRFGEEEAVEIYSFDEMVPFGIFPGLEIRLADYV